MVEAGDREVAAGQLEGECRTRLEGGDAFLEPVLAVSHRHLAGRADSRLSGRAHLRSAHGRVVVGELGQVARMAQTRVKGASIEMELVSVVIAPSYVDRFFFATLLW